MQNATFQDVIEGRARWSFERCNCLARLRDMPDACVDAVITDAPYSSGGFTRGDRMAAPSAKYEQSGQKLERVDFAGDNRDQRSFGYWCALWLAECLRIARPGSPICLFTDWRQLPTTTDALQAGGWVWRGILPWDKTEGARPMRGRFTAQCEYVVWGSAARSAVMAPSRPIAVSHQWRATSQATTRHPDLCAATRSGPVPR